MTPSPTGLVLAAGAGRRFGGPKALAREADGTSWTARAVATLRAAGCGRVVVVLGAAAEEARALLPPTADAVVAEGWEQGLSASLATGLAAAAGAPAVLVTLVDLPDLPAEAARRVLGDAPGPGSLRRAVYDGRPGHPVLVGADHVAPMVASLGGDRGGGAYLVRAGADRIECGDLFSGADRDERR